MIFPFLRDHGVLGLNARNLLYVKPFNPRKAVAFADDKMKTKSYLSARGIPTARVFARIDSRSQLWEFDFSTLPDECVLKPNYGFGGQGILILKGRKDGAFLEQGKKEITDEELTEHIEDILDGKFSVNGRRDTAFFEQILTPGDCFAPFRPAGLPDIRIIVFNLVPVMAMLRIPTPESRGKANIHLGGIGIGIDMAKGVTTHGAQYDRVITELPHGFPVAGVEIPNWEDLLLIAARIQYITNIGYLAVDLTIDAERGPVLLEVNARAGLTVQVANLAPLKARLERVGGLVVSTPEKGVRIAQELFGERIPGKEEDPKLQERPILGVTETIEFVGEGVLVHELSAIAPEREETVFHPTFVHELLARELLDPVGEQSRGLFKAKFGLGKQRIQTIVREGETGPVRAVIGRRDLRSFLIDPSKRQTGEQPRSALRSDLKSIDRLLCSIDRDLTFLKLLRPLNLPEELSRARADEQYNPVFSHRKLPEDLGEMEEDVRKTVSDDSALGIILRKKKRELLLKIDLLRARGDSDRFTAASLALFGAPSPALIGFATEYLSTEVPPESAPEEQTFNAEALREEFERVLREYGLHDWHASIRTALVSDCAVGNRKIFIREGATFTESRVRSLIAHEIETHVLTAENGAIQPYEIFRRGFANYLDTQEGLAIWNQQAVLPKGHEKRRRHALSVLAVSFGMEHSFAETRAYLVQSLGLTAERALSKTVDLKRGLSRTAEAGAFTKALTYFRGFRAVDHFLKSGGNLRKLYVGKVALEDLPLIDAMEGVKPPLLLPVSLRVKAEEKQVKRVTKRRPKPA